MADGNMRAPDEGVNVQVLLRCRPMSDKEIAERTPQVITCNEAQREVTLFSSNGGKTGSRTFRFDKVFGCDSTQEKLFKQAISPIVDEVMDGFNCTIFAYGQTGTGKTYTMEGGPRESDDGRRLSAQAGVIPRAIKQVFDTIEASNIDSTVKVSFLELYNEELTDLLVFDDDSRKMRLLEDRAGVVVQGLEEVIVRSATEIYQVLDRGTAKRRTAATLLNQRSSRSHSVFTITIHMKETTPEGEDVIKIGKLNLVDLAGSENISRSGAKDGRAREAGSINQSLLTLGRVITALVEHSGHVPYRDSKLTRLLRDSLGGRTKTCIIATIAPTVQCQDETISTLDYAHRAKNIRNRPELNQKISKTTMIKELGAEIEKLKLDLQATREKNGVYLSTERFEAGELERAQLRESLKVARAELELAEAGLEAKDAALTAAQEEMRRLTGALQERTFVGASLRRAELSLAGFAEALTTELGAYGQDIQTLLAALDQATALHSSERHCLRGVAEVVATRLAGFRSHLAAGLDGQRTHLAAIGEDVGSFVARKQQAVCELQAQLSGIAAGVEALQATAAQHVGALETAAAGAFDRASADATHALDGAAEAARQAGNAAAAALEALVQTLRAQAGALQATAERHAREAVEVTAALQEYQATAVTSLQGTAAAAQSLAQAQAAATAQVEDVVGGLLAAFTHSAQQQQAKLVREMQALVAASAEEQAASLAAGLRAMHKGLARNNETVAQQAAAAGTSAQAAIVQLASMDSTLREKLSGVQAALQDSVNDAVRASTAAAASGEAATEQQRVGTARAVAAMAADHKALVATLEQGRAFTHAARREADAELASGAVHLVGMHGVVAQTVRSQHEEAVVFAGALSRQADDAITALQGLGQAAQAALVEAEQDVGSRATAALAVPAPAAPVLRDHAPVQPITAIQALMCPPDDVLVLQLRNTQKEIQKRGGDVRKAGVLLLSPKLQTAPVAASGAENVRPLGARSPRSPATDKRPAAETRSSRIPGFLAKPSMTAPTMDGSSPVRSMRMTGLADCTNY